MEELVIEAKTNDKAFEKLINMYEYKIRLFTKQYFYKGGDKEDILQLARIGIWKAVKSYENDKSNSNIDLYIYINMKNNIIDGITSANRIKHQILSNACCKDLRSDISENLNIEELIIKKETIKELYKKIDSAKLSEKEKTVIKYKLNEFGNKEIAEITGLTTKQVSNSYERVIAKIKKSIRK